MGRLGRRGLRLDSLSAQMIVSFVALVLLTAVAVGLPALWLIREQLDGQAWAQVDQGGRAALALYEARQSELEGLATLTAQRPTLHQLLATGGQVALAAYLRTLQEGSGLDVVLICDVNRQPVGRSGRDVAGDLCEATVGSGFVVVPTGATWEVWLVASHPLDSEEGGSGTDVIVGVVLDDAFATQMRDQTGLEHTLRVAGRPVSSSLPARGQWTAEAVDEGPGRCTLDDGAYYAACFPLGTVDLEAEVALDVSGIAATQRRLAWALVGSILVVAVVASLLGMYLTRRIGGPLARLAGAAEAMSKGNLETPLTVEARVREVSLVAQALEGARADLKRTLAELRQEKAWTDHLLEAIVEGIVTLDRRGRITFFSHGAERITGWHRDEVLGRTCDLVFEPLEADEPFSQLIPPPGQRRKISVAFRDDRQAILAMTGARLLPPEGGDARVALVFRDISEEEAVHRLLGLFLANVAHEFRTPLSSLAASVELLLDQAPDLRPDELEELLGSVHLGVLGLQTLIDNLLESASIEAGHFYVRARPANLGDIIAEAIVTMQPLLDKHGQRLVVELPASLPVVRADPRRTVQVLVNLLSNAHKYGPDEAEIQVSVVVEGAWARVRVADSGPGVPPQYRKDLFRRFVQPAAGNDKAQVGVGLGLSVVKAVVEGHGGQVGVEGQEGGGSVFWFTLPLEAEA